MLKNYLHLAIKNFRKHKLFSLINILGLMIGITCCLMIFLFIENEFSYDSFHKNGKDIYRVMRTSTTNGQLAEIPYLSPPYSTDLLNEYPSQIKNAIRVMPDDDLITYGNTSFHEKKFYLTDSNFFQFFSFKLLRGNPATVLNNPNSVVMTESAAKKYFGSADPIGKVVSLNVDQLQLKVTGIAEDVPSNSHLDFDMVMPITHWRNTAWFNNMPNNSLFVYVQLNPNTNVNQLSQRFPQFMSKYLGKYYDEMGFKMGLKLKPLHDIYFEDASPFDSVKHGNKKMVYIFMCIAVLILVIACINFMNLATARATDRSKEVGMRKVMGALRFQLIKQFILESLLFATVACLFAVGLLQLLMPVYTNLLGYKLPFYWSNPWFYTFLVGIILIVGFLAGSYPALLLSSFSPIESLRGKLKIGKNGAFFRKTLVVFQFSISVLLITGVTVIMKQMNFLRTTDLGFDKTQSMIVKIDNHSIWNEKINFKSEVAKNPYVQSVSLMTGEPGGFHDFYSFEAESKPGEKLLFNTEYADFEFAKTLGLKFTAGRDFSASFPTDSLRAAIVNRSVCDKLGYKPEQAIGKWIKNIQKDSVPRTIIGVVEDYHYSSLKQEIGPLVISPDTTDRRVALIKLNTTNLPQTIGNIKKIYSNLVPAYPFEYDFLDEKFNRLYKTEATQQTVLEIFSMIAILIACLGLFGLAAYTATKRTKEIGVRKVLGSSVQNIMLLLSKDLLKPVLIGTAIAIPFGYYATNKWLENFAYRTDVQWWIFVMAGMIALLIALITVSFQSIKAATANPVKSLKTE